MLNDSEVPQPVMSVDLAQAILREYAERPPVNQGERYWVHTATRVLTKAAKQAKESQDV